MCYVHKIHLYIIRIYMYSWAKYTLNCAFLSYYITCYTLEPLNVIDMEMCISKLTHQNRVCGKLPAFLHVYTNRIFISPVCLFYCINFHIFFACTSNDPVNKFNNSKSFQAHIKHTIPKERKIPFLDQTKWHLSLM